MKEFKLSDITIGFAEGEKEAQENNFLDIFYTQNNKYSELLQKYKFIISGRKGTGKTILAKYYQKVNNNGLFIVDYIKLEKIALNYYIEMYSPKIDKDISKLFQEYYIYNQYIQTIINNKRKLKDFYPKNPSLIDKFKSYFKYKKYINIYNKIKDLYFKIYPNGVYKEIDIKTMKRIIGNDSISATIGNKIAKIDTSIGETNESSTERTLVKKNFAENINQFKELVLSCLQYIDVTLIIDNLDEIKMDDTNSLVSFLIDLVGVVNEINISTTLKSEKSKCILLIRSDIIDLFNSRNANINKILIDSNVELEWFKNGTELEKMIMYKISKSDITNSMAEYLPKDIKYIIFEKSHSDLYDTAFDKIVKFSFGRPRDVITYIDCVIKNYPNEKQITFEMLKTSELTYSQKILNEIRNEMSIKYSPEEIENTLSLLRNYGKSIFKYSEIIDFYKEHIDLYKNITDINDTLQYLYQLGVIGNSRKEKKSKKGKKYIIYYNWSYRNGGNILNKDWDIVIHFSIRKALNIM